MSITFSRLSRLGQFNVFNITTNIRENVKYSNLRFVIDMYEEIVCNMLQEWCGFLGRG